MLKKFTSVRFILTIGLLLSVAFAAYSIYYKVRYWGFDFAPKKSTAVWTIEAQISFMPNGEPIKVSLATPKVSKEYKILDEDTVADGYKVSKDTKENRIVLTSAPREDKQQLYYRILLFDNEDGRGKIPAPVPSNPEKPVFDEQRLAVAKELLELSTKQPGNVPQQVIRLLNQNPPDATVLAFLPMKKGQKDIAEATGNLLALRNVPTRMVRGIKLEENKKSFSFDIRYNRYRHRIFCGTSAERSCDEGIVGSLLRQDFPVGYQAGIYIRI